MPVEGVPIRCPGSPQHGGQALPVPMERDGQRDLGHLHLRFLHYISGRVACLMGVEGGHILEDSLAALRTFQRLGARLIDIGRHRRCGENQKNGDQRYQAGGGLSKNPMAFTLS